LQIVTNPEWNYFSYRNISHKSAKEVPVEKYSLLTGTNKETSAKICYFKETDLLFFAQTLHKRYTAGDRCKYSAFLSCKYSCLVPVLSGWYINTYHRGFLNGRSPVSHAAILQLGLLYFLFQIPKQIAVQKFMR